VARSYSPTGESSIWYGFGFPRYLATPDVFALTTHNDLVSIGNGADGTKYQGWEFIRAHPNLSWTLEKVTPGAAWSAWILRSKATGCRCSSSFSSIEAILIRIPSTVAVDLDNGGTGDGTKIQGWQYYGGRNQQWYIITQDQGNPTTFM